ncbi:MAG TPA: oxidoreductase, partial [Planctomycetaceae bacterium]|nr:oxidoreductase [Planctomycetaceae bacterium]
YRLEPREPGLTETQYQCRNWYHFCWLSGDDVTQSLVHNLDRVGWILGEETPKWAFALGGRSSSFGEVYGDMFDHSAVVYEYESGPRVYALCQTRHNCYGNPGDIIMGTKGTCDLFRNRIDGETKWRFRGPKNNPYQAEHDALFASIREGKPINSGNHMATGTLVAVMGQIASYSGGPVTWDEVSRSNLEFGPTPDEASFNTPPPVTPDATGNYPIPKPGITPLVV